MEDERATFRLDLASERYAARSPEQAVDGTATDARATAGERAEPNAPAEEADLGTVPTDDERDD